MTENKAHRGWAGAIDLLGFSGLLRSVMGRKSFEVVVVQRRFATPEEVRQGQRLQAERRARGEDLHLGQILLEQRIISGHQLAEALSRSGERRLSTSEATFRLATRLQSGFSPSQKVVLACSAVEEPALLDLVSQLSLALALMDGGPVLLVDGNLRTPWLHRYYSLPAAPGLSDVLRGKVEFDVAVKSLELKDLSVLTAGSPEPDALSVLDSIKLSTLIAHSSTRFRRVLVAAPPALQYADAARLGAHADGVLLAVTAGKSSKREVAEFHELFQEQNIPVIGTVLCEV